MKDVQKEWVNGRMGAASAKAMAAKEWKRPVHAPIPPFPHSPILLAGLLLGLGLAGCRRATPPPPVDRPLSVQVTISTNEIHVGDLVDVYLDVAYPEEGKLKIPELPRDQEIVVRHQTVERRPAAAGRAAARIHYALTSLKVGTWEMFTNSLHVARADGSDLAASLPAVTLTVASTLTGSDEPLRDIKGLVDWPAAIPRWIPVLILIGVLALLLGGLARRYLIRPRLILKDTPVQPPHEVALRALRALREKNYIQTGQAEPFYLEVSRIVRQYLENRFDLRAPEQTTEEFIREASTSRRLSREHQDVTTTFLEQSDLVKFARFRPTATDMETAFQAAEKLVRETQPVQSVEPVNASQPSLVT